MSDLAAAVRAQPPEWREQVQIGLGLQTLTIDGIPDAAPGEWSPLDVLIGNMASHDEMIDVLTNTLALVLSAVCEATGETPDAVVRRLGLLVA